MRLSLQFGFYDDSEDALSDQISHRLKLVGKYFNDW
jgi:hypothetical protein